jgi:uncharacterized Fe-S cluster-containing MiaB family protein
VVAAIERYSVSGDLLEFEGLDCDCKRIWMNEVKIDTSFPAVLGTGIARRGDILLNLRSP